MAVLGIDILLTLVREKKLIENLSERDLTNSEGTGFDLRAGELYELLGPGYLGVDIRETSPTGKEPIAKYDEHLTHKVVIPSGSSYLVRTIEIVNLPEDLLARIKPRTTLFRSGVSLETGWVNPGYKGELTFSLFNFGPFDFTLEMGARIAHIVFEPIEGRTQAYRGQWQGGRVSTEGEEKQI